MDMTDIVNSYIIDHWKNTIRTQISKPEEISLPYPVTVPCENQRFTYFFYWDTYFINIGLLYDMPQQALNNLRNMKYLIEKLGFIPNANLTTMFNRSQAPLFCSAVYDYYNKFPSLEVVREFYPSMVCEYEFWMSERMSDCGLNRYSSSANETDIQNFIVELSQRGILDIKDPESSKKAKNLFAEAESGWDFTPRFAGRALDFAPVDLNSILYKNECILSEFAKLLEKKEESDNFAAKAEYRRSLMNRLMKNENNLYLDYDYINGTHSELLSAASFLPYWAGVSKDKESCKNLADILDCEYGLSACEKSDRELYQWDYPNMWPPLVEFAVSALRAVGADGEARRVAEKYMCTITKNFETDGCLYEKYSAVTGRYSDREYQAAKMLGWTAGVFRKLYESYRNQ